MDTKSFNELLSPVWQAVLWPGDTLLAAILTYAPNLADRIGLDAAMPEFWLSAAISATAWVFAALAARKIFFLAKRMLHSIAGLVSTLRLAVKSRYFLVRGSAAATIATVRSWFADRDTTEVTEIALSNLDRAILAIEARLEPGTALTAADFAARLGVLPSEAQASLEKLQACDLVSRNLASADDFEGYSITQSGRFIASSGSLSKSTAG